MFISILNFIFLSVALLIIRFLLENNQFSYFNIESDTIIILFLITLLIWMNLSQSISSKLISKLVLVHLQAISKTTQRSTQRIIMNERFLLEGWINFIVNLTQFLLFLLFIVYLGGLQFLFGLVITMPLLFVTGRKYFKLASKYSVLFLEEQNSFSRNNRKNSESSNSQDSQRNSFLVSIYNRDIFSFRVPVSYNLVSVLVLFLPIALITLLSSNKSLTTTILLAALILRSQLFATFDSIGRLAWVLSLWIFHFQEDLDLDKGSIDEN